MNYFLLPKKAARLIVLQRIEVINFFLKKLRKFFGRYIFSNFITKFFLNSDLIGKKYYEVMLKEYFTIKDSINHEDKFFLSIGGGLGGLELIINKNFKDKLFYFIERNYVSKKVKYGWGGMKNDEAYNNLEIQKIFLEKNGMLNDQINIYDYDNDQLPLIKFDVITSLLSLDYHYDFNIYFEYLKKVSKKETIIIFDTIRADYFKDIFKNVKVISSDIDTVHKSKRIICSEFLN